MNKPIGTTIKRTLLRSILKVGIRTINLKHKKGEMNIGEMQKRINAPGGKKILIDVIKPNLLMGYVVEKGEQVKELPSNNPDLFDVRVIVYDGAIMFDFIKGWAWYYGRDDYGRFKIKDRYSFLDAWAHREIDYEGLSQKYWVGDVNWVGKIWDEIMEEIRIRLKNATFFKRLLKEDGRYEFGKKYYY